jgi:hypothetical protein
MASSSSSSSSSTRFASEPRLAELAVFLQRQHKALFTTAQSAEAVVSSMAQFVRSTATDAAFLHQFAQFCRGERVEALLDSRIAAAAAADVVELEQAIAAVRRIQEDYQAIAWQTHDNERHVLAALQRVFDFVERAEPDSAHWHTFVNFKAVDILLAYFEADSRRNVRVLLLQLLGSLSAVLPASATRSMALALSPLLCADIAALLAAADEPLDAEWLMYCALVLTCAINAEQDDGTPMFATLAAHTLPDAGVLLAGLLALLERGCPDATAEIDGAAVDSTVLLCLLTINTKLPRLALDVGADDDSGNELFRALLAAESSQRFTQLVLNAFNESGSNPVMFTPSVIFVRDLLVHPVACNLFYSNDLSVLVDVILRHMINISETHPQRVHLLEASYGLVRNCDFVKLGYKVAEMVETVRWQAEDDGANDDARSVATRVLEAIEREQVDA